MEKGDVCKGTQESLHSTKDEFRSLGEGVVLNRYSNQTIMPPFTALLFSILFIFDWELHQKNLTRLMT